MRNTINYNLKLPEGPDKYNISDFNENTEKIDGELKKHADYIADRYNKTEIDNKFSMHEMNIDWKESVDTFNDIAVAYPAPESGWTVNVKDTNYTYRYDGTDWIAISSNAIPKATQAVDGLMSKEQAAVLNKLDQAVGSLQNLTTSEKQSLVGAVNEVKSEVIQLNADLGGMKIRTFTTTTPTVASQWQDALNLRTIGDYNEIFGIQTMLSVGTNIYANSTDLKVRVYDNKVSYLVSNAAYINSPCLVTLMYR
nr:hypothetical protein [uncultured Anaerostipes sp.]